MPVKGFGLDFRRSIGSIRPNDPIGQSSDKRFGCILSPAPRADLSRRLRKLLRRIEAQNWLYRATRKWPRSGHALTRVRVFPVNFQFSRITIADCNRFVEESVEIGNWRQNLMDFPRWSGSSYSCTHVAHRWSPETHFGSASTEPIPTRVRDWFSKWKTETIVVFATRICVPRAFADECVVASRSFLGCP